MPASRLRPAPVVRQTLSCSCACHTPLDHFPQIEFLEVRLSEVMAYADIPPSMRPALSEFDPVSLIIGKGDGGGGGFGGGGSGGGGGGGLAGIRAAQVEAVKATILKSLGMLREIRTSFGECRGGKLHMRRGVLLMLPFTMLPLPLPLCGGGGTVAALLCGLTRPPSAAMHPAQPRSAMSVTPSTSAALTGSCRS